MTSAIQCKITSMMFCILPTDILYFLEIGLYCCEKLVKCLFLSDTTDVFRDHDFL